MAVLNAMNMWLKMVAAFWLLARGRSPRGSPYPQSAKAYTVVYYDVHFLNTGATMYMF